MTYSKPFKTYSEQIDILENQYKLIIHDKVFAEAALCSIGYYDLVNGYKECLMCNDEFLHGTTFKFIHAFYFIDKSIQAILLKYSMLVENSFKSKLAYILAKNFGVHQDEYLNPSNYFTSNSNISFSTVKSNCEAVYKPNDARPIPQPTKHYCQKHNHIPPWILFKNVTFSNTINLFHLLKKPEKEKLSNMIMFGSNLSYDDKVDYIISSLNIVRDFRNKIAHNLKFVTHKSYHRLKPRVINQIMANELFKSKRDNKNNLALCDIYAYILCIIYLLKGTMLDYYFCIELANTFNTLKNSKQQGAQDTYLCYLQVTNLPKDIDYKLERYISKLGNVYSK